MKDIMNFVSSYSGVLLAILAVLVSIGKAVVSKNKQQIYANIYTLVCEAESIGGDKKQYVLDNIYKRLPWYIKIFIYNEQEIEMAIEFVLNRFKAFAKKQMEPAKMIYCTGANISGGTITADKIASNAITRY
jgi:hypothetical protein